MTVLLEVADGSPWWLSNDIWTVPNDPEGAPGAPIVGQPCYLWAHVQNNGDQAVENAQVRFYWADPSVGFDRTTATVVGSSNVTLAPASASDVLCLTPWVPIFVNGGHECVLAEAFHASLDPLPATTIFDVPTDRHVAQRNLSVLAAPEKRIFHLAFEVHNPGRFETRYRVTVRKGDVKEALQATRRYPDLHKILQANKPGVVHDAGFVEGACPDVENFQPKDRFEVGLNPKQRTGVSVVGRLEGAFAFLHIEQQAISQNRKAVIGGLSLLIVNEAHHA